MPIPFQTARILHFSCLANPILVWKCLWSVLCLCTKQDLFDAFLSVCLTRLSINWYCIYRYSKSFWNIEHSSESTSFSLKEQCCQLCLFSRTLQKYWKLQWKRKLLLQFRKWFSPLKTTFYWVTWSQNDGTPFDLKFDLLELLSLKVESPQAFYGITLCCCQQKHSALEIVLHEKMYNVPKNNVRTT